MAHIDAICTLNALCTIRLYGACKCKLNLHCVMAKGRLETILFDDYGQCEKSPLITRGENAVPEG